MRLLRGGLLLASILLSAQCFSNAQSFGDEAKVHQIESNGLEISDLLLIDPRHYLLHREQFLKEQRGSILAENAVSNGEVFVQWNRPVDALLCYEDAVGCLRKAGVDPVLRSRFLSGYFKLLRNQKKFDQLNLVQREFPEQAFL